MNTVVSHQVTPEPPERTNLQIELKNSILMTSICPEFRHRFQTAPPHEMQVKNVHQQLIHSLMLSATLTITKVMLIVCQEVEKSSHSEALYWNSGQIITMAYFGSNPRCFSLGDSH